MPQISSRPASRGKRNRRIIAGEGIVIGDGERTEAHAHRFGNQFRRRECAVRLIGMAVKIDHLPIRPLRFQLAPDLVHAFLHRFPVRVHHDVGIERRLVGIGNPREIAHLARQRVLVETLHVARCENLDRAIDEHFDEIGDLPLHLVAGLAIRRDRRHHHDHAVARKQFSSQNRCAGYWYRDLRG